MSHTHHEFGPSYTGSVVLELGAAVGALVIYTGKAQLGREIEISPSGSTANHRTHVAVRERHLDGQTLYGAVYPGLAAGLYTIWNDANTPVGNVKIEGSKITEYTWPTLD